MVGALAAADVVGALAAAGGVVALAAADGVVAPAAADVVDPRNIRSYSVAAMVMGSLSMINNASFFNDEQCFNDLFMLIFGLLTTYCR